MKTKNLNGYSNIVGSNIRKYRKLKWLSQRQLADQVALLGVTLYYADISNIENFNLFIRDFEQQAICKVLGITIQQLFENTDKYFD